MFLIRATNQAQKTKPSNEPGTTATGCVLCDRFSDGSRVKVKKSEGEKNSKSNQLLINDSHTLCDHLWLGTSLPCAHKALVFTLLLARTAHMHHNFCARKTRRTKIGDGVTTTQATLVPCPKGEEEVKLEASQNLELFRPSLAVLAPQSSSIRCCAWASSTSEQRSYRSPGCCPR